MHKASRGDGVPAELFLILKDDPVKVLRSISEKSSSGHRTGKAVFITNTKKDNAKECSDYRTTALISHASKVMLKILQARLQQYENRELPAVQVVFRKGRGTRD